MSITNAHHTSFSVNDMQESLAFYRELLGFEVVNERPAVTDAYFREIVGFPDAVVYAVLLRIPGTDHYAGALGIQAPARRSAEPQPKQSRQQSYRIYRRRSTGDGSGLGRSWSGIHFRASGPGCGAEQRRLGAVYERPQRHRHRVVSTIQRLKSIYRHENGWGRIFKITRPT